MCIVYIQANYEDGCFSGFQGTVLKMVFKELGTKTNKQKKTNTKKPPPKTPEHFLLVLITKVEMPSS